MSFFTNNAYASFHQHLPPPMQSLEGKATVTTSPAKKTRSSPRKQMLIGQFTGRMDNSSFTSTSSTTSTISEFDPLSPLNLARAADPWHGNSLLTPSSYYSGENDIGAAASLKVYASDQTTDDLDDEEWGEFMNFSQDPQPSSASSDSVTRRHANGVSMRHEGRDGSGWQRLPHANSRDSDDANHEMDSDHERCFSSRVVCVGDSVAFVFGSFSSLNLNDSPRPSPRSSWTTRLFSRNEEMFTTRGYDAYDVTFENGPIGLELETDWYGRQVVVKGFKPVGGNNEEGPAKRCGIIRIGGVLTAINGESCLEMNFQDTLARLRAVSKGKHVLHFKSLEAAGDLREVLPPASANNELTYGCIERIRGETVTPFNFHREDTGEFLMACSCVNEDTGVFLFHTLQDSHLREFKDLPQSEDSAVYLGQMVPNFLGTEFTVLDHQQKRRNEFGFLVYSSNVMGRVPNFLKCVFPRQSPVTDEEDEDTYGSSTTTSGVPCRATAGIGSGMGSNSASFNVHNTMMDRNGNISERYKKLKRSRTLSIVERLRHFSLDDLKTSLEYAGGSIDVLWHDDDDHTGRARSMRVKNSRSASTRDMSTPYGAAEQNDYQCDLLTNETKKPAWNDELGAWTLNFHGRVKLASKKNFLLVPEQGNEQMETEFSEERVYLRFGKVSKSRFSLDYQAPISPLMAVAIVCSSFAHKIAVTPIRFAQEEDRAPQTRQILHASQLMRLKMERIAKMNTKIGCFIGYYFKPSKTARIVLKESQPQQEWTHLACLSEPKVSRSACFSAFISCCSKAPWKHASLVEESPMCSRRYPSITALPRTSHESDNLKSGNTARQVRASLKNPSRPYTPRTSPRSLFHGDDYRPESRPSSSYSVAEKKELARKQSDSGDFKQSASSSAATAPSMSMLPPRPTEKKKTESSSSSLTEDADPLSASSSSSHLKLVHAPILAADELLPTGKQHGIYSHEASNDANENDEHLEASLELPSQEQLDQTYAMAQRCLQELACLTDPTEADETIEHLRSVVHSFLHQSSFFMSSSTESAKVQRLRLGLFHAIANLVLEQWSRSAECVVALTPCLLDLFSADPAVCDDVDSSAQVILLGKWLFMLSKDSANDAFFCDVHYVEAALSAIAKVSVICCKEAVLRSERHGGSKPQDDLKVNEELSFECIVLPFPIKMLIYLADHRDLRNLSVAKSYQKQFLEAQVPSRLCSMIPAFIGHLELMGNASRILSKLTLHELPRAQINNHMATNLRNLLAVVDADRNKSLSLLDQQRSETSRHQDSLLVRMYFVLGNLCAGNDRDRQCIAFECNGITVLLRALQFYALQYTNGVTSQQRHNREKDDVGEQTGEVLVKLVRALANIAINADVATELNGRDEMGVLLETLDQAQRVGDEELMLNIVSCITNVSYYSSVTPVPDPKSSQTIPRASKYSFIESNRIVLTSLLAQILLDRNEEAVVEATRAFGNLAQFKDVLAYMSDHKVLDCFVVLLDHSNREIVYTVCGVLMNAALDESTRRKLLQVRAGDAGSSSSSGDDRGDVRNLLLGIVECAATDDVEMTCMACKVLYNLLLTKDNANDKASQSSFQSSSLHRVIQQIMTTMELRDRRRKSIGQSGSDDEDAEATSSDWRELRLVLPQLLRSC
ncbi:hypothetical protein FI667_g15397, partial [Globisporangium splendens]